MASVGGGGWMPLDQLHTMPVTREPAAEDTTPGAGDENNGDDNKPFWQDEPKQNAGAGAPTPTSPVQPTPDAANPDAQFDSFYNQLNLGVEFSAEQNAEMGQGNFASLAGVINEAIKRSYRAGIEHAGTIAQKRANEAVETAVTRSSQHVAGKDAIGQLHAALPFTAHQDFAPVASGVFNKAIQRSNGDVAKAIDLTKGFFKQMGQLSAKELSGGDRPARRGMRQPAAADGSVDYDPAASDGERIDFVELLGGLDN